VSGGVNESSGDSSGKNKALLVDQPNRWASWKVRFYATWSMLGFFAFLVYIGHFALLTLILILQTLIFKEIVSHGQLVSRERKLPGFKALQW